MSLPELHDLRGAALYLNVSNATIKRKVEAGEIEYTESLDGKILFTNEQLTAIVTAGRRAPGVATEA